MEWSTGLDNHIALNAAQYSGGLGCGLCVMYRYNSCNPLTERRKAITYMLVCFFTCGLVCTEFLAQYCFVLLGSFTGILLANGLARFVSTRYTILDYRTIEGMNSLPVDVVIFIHTLECIAEGWDLG